MIFRQTTDVLDVDFVIYIANGQPPPSVTIRYVSDRWVGAEDEILVPFSDLVMPTSSDSHTPRLDIPFLPLSAVQNSALESVLGQHIHSFNALQSQAFWSVVRTRHHALLCAPTGCGKYGITINLERPYKRKSKTEIHLQAQSFIQVLLRAACHNLDPC